MKLAKILIAISFFSMVAECGEALAASYTVCDSGCNYTTIQAALNACTTGIANTITVQDAYTTTTEDVSVTKSGQNASSRLVIQATGATKTFHSLSMSGSYVTVDGFLIDGNNSGTGSSGNALVYVTGTTTDIVLKNNTLKNPGATSAGIKIWQTGSNDYPRNVTIQNNTITYETGTAQWPGPQLLLNGSNSLIIGNLFFHHQGGDFIDIFGHDHIIRGNEVTGNPNNSNNADHPDVFQSWGAGAGVSYNILIENNFIHDLGDCALGQIEQNCGTGSSACTSAHSGSFTTVGSTTATDTSQNWTANQFAAEFVLMIFSGTAERNVYLISSNSNQALTITDMNGNPVNLTTDGVRDGDQYKIYKRIGWWTFRNNIFLNIGYEGAANWGSYAPYIKFYNNTFYKVGPTQGHLIFSDGGGYGLAWHGEVYNNIFLENYNGGTYAGWISWINGFEPAHDYNYVGGTSYGTKSGFTEPHGINGGNPMLINEGGASAADYRLQPTSFLKDTGKTIDGFSTDYAGNHRPSGAWDIGAYEYVSGATVAPPAAPAGLTVR